MSEISIQAKRRTLSTKSAVNQIRKNGNVPGIYYTKDTEPIPIVLPELSLKPLVYTSEAHLVDLIIDDTESKKTILKNIQFDPVTDRIIHCDFLGISLDDEIEIEVPILVTGNAKGIKEGGLVQHQMHKVTISCLPTNIPEHITVDVTNLGVGDSITVADLNIDNVKFLQNDDVIIVAVAMPRAVAETTSADGTETEIKQPEVIGKGKATEEEE